MTKCGCRVYAISGPDPAWVDIINELLETRYCPLHAAAEKMRDLLRELLAIGNNNMTTLDEAHEELSALHSRVTDFLAGFGEGAYE